MAPRRQLQPRVAEALPPEFGEDGMGAEEEDDRAFNPPPAAPRAARPQTRRSMTSEPIFDPHEGHGVTPSGQPIDSAVNDVPIFGEALQSGQLARIRVESMGADGSFSVEGTLPAHATQENMIAMWPRAGTFRLLPIDMNNRAVGAPVQITVSDTNLTLVRALQARGSSAFGGGMSLGSAGHYANAPSANDPQVYNLLDKFMTAQKEDREQTLAMIQNERMHAEQMKREAEEKMAAANILIAERSSKLSEDIISQQAMLSAKQQDIAAQNTHSLFATMSAQNNTVMQQLLATQQMAERDAASRMEAERQRAKLEMERLKLEADLARQRASDEAQAERDRARLRIEEDRQAMRERLEQDRLNMEERERLRAEQNSKLEEARERIRQEDLERQRKHDEMMEKHREEARKDERERRAAIDALQASKDPIGATLGMVTTIFGAAKKLGFDPAEILQGALTKTTSGWTDVIKEGVGLVKEVVKTVNLSNGAAPDEDDEEGEEDPNEMVQVRLQDGSVKSITRAQLAQLQAQQAARQAQQAQIPAAPPQQLQAPQPGGAQWAQPEMDPAMAVAMGMTTQFHPQHSQGQGMVAAAPGSAYPQQGGGGSQGGGYPGQQFAGQFAGQPQFGQPQFAPQQFAPPPVPVQQNPDAHAMHQASVAFVDQLETLPESEWSQALTMWVVNTGPERVINHLQAMTIRGALRDGGASADMIEKVIAMVNASPIVPADIPRG